MLGKIGVAVVVAGLGLGTWTIIDADGCTDECHGYAIPLAIAAVLVLAGTVALLIAAVSWSLRRQLTTRDR
ncbi:MAG TPA: hypothetical protein VM121_00010 [Acidimicrobiales bacterium]|nr:hypothetical protein [Acidimicrobiales bacterium]